MDYYFKSLKKFPFIFLFFYILGCSHQVTISEDSYVIKNIYIIDPIDGLQSTKSVIITDNIITKIIDNDNELIANNNSIIDASGKYLIPGLWDAHIHFSFDTDLAPYMPGLFIAHGVTSVRDTGGPIDLVVKMKDLSLMDPIYNPTVYIAGPLIDGTPNVYNNSSPSFPLLSIENSDIIDIESPSTLSGKDQGSDVENDKLTYPSIVGIEISKVRAVDLAEQAKEKLQLLDKNTDNLCKLADYIVSRKT